MIVHRALRLFSPCIPLLCSGEVIIRPPPSPICPYLPSSPSYGPFHRPPGHATDPFEPSNVQAFVEKQLSDFLSDCGAYADSFSSVRKEEVLTRLIDQGYVPACS